MNTRPIAIIPVAGVGSRLRPHTHTVPKALINVAGKPMLAHILDELEKIGIDEAVFVIGHMGDQIANYVQKKHPRIKSTFIEQPDRKGLGHAIWLTKEAVGERPALIILGDTIFRADFRGVLAAGISSLGVKEVEDPRRFGVAIVVDGRITRLVEKPDSPISKLAIVGIYYLIHSGRLFACLDELIAMDQTTKGEYQLTDALELMLRKGEPMTVFAVDGWYDCGKTETLLSTNQELLDLEAKPMTLPGSVIVDPVAIDPSAVIENSIIGPHVSIAAGAVVRCAVVRNSIINENAHVELILLDGSLIGEQAVVKGHFKRLNVGDSSEIEMA
ncbi:MAG: sugar phosphate nucleotidyltransferase [Candidatus Eisenbacteria bacterium]|nr:sugar phosphate nucleotidyltransferase [Candidatus Eisenbacteria bacterium]